MSETPDAALLPARRVVTGHDENGKSKVLYDDESNVDIFFNGSLRSQTIWYTDDVPVDCSPATDADPTLNKFVDVAKKGSACAVTWIAPGTSLPMHRTKTLDYQIVLEGEVELELDNDNKHVMKAGDVIVQRETMHAWHNRTTKWAKVLFVIVASKTSEEV